MRTTGPSLSDNLPSPDAQRRVPSPATLARSQTPPSRRDVIAAVETAEYIHGISPTVAGLARRLSVTIAAVSKTVDELAAEELLERSESGGVQSIR